MKRLLQILVPAALVALLLTACVVPPSPYGQTLELLGGEYSLAAGSVTIVIDENGQNTVSLAGSGSGMQHYRLSVDEARKEIRLNMARGAIRMVDTRNIVLTVNAPVNSVRVSGSASVTYHDASVSSFSLQASGSCRGNFSFAQPLGRLDVRLSGSSNFTFAGAAEQVDYSASGSSRIHALGLTAQHVNLRMSGSGNVSQGFAAEGGTFSGSASGSSRIAYTGSPAISIRTSGSVRISPHSD